MFYSETAKPGWGFFCLRGILNKTKTIRESPAAYVCKCIPSAVQMQYIKGQAKMMANFLAKQMKNTQTSHDIKKGYFIFVGGRKWKPIKRENKPPKAGVVLLLATLWLPDKIKMADNQTINSHLQYPDPVLYLYN